MAKSRFEYVKSYELSDALLPNAYIVIRVDGRGFHKFSDAHDFEKPNDVRALDLMNRAAKAVMDEFPDIVLAFGESDEYSFLMRKAATVYGRRRAKLNSAVASIFTATYVFHWTEYFPNTPLRYPPTFDSRVVLYPGEKEVRDYFSWRQADTHINNLYNTCFWALVHGGATPREANKALQGTNSKDKNEMLWAQFNTNYNNIPAYFRKGSVLVRVDPNPVTVTLEADAPDAPDTVDDVPSGFATPRAASAGDADDADEDTAGDTPAREVTVAAVAGDDAAIMSSPDISAAPKRAGGSTSTVKKSRAPAKPYDGISGEIVVLHEDIIRNPFWRARPWLLA